MNCPNCGHPITLLEEYMHHCEQCGTLTEVWGEEWRIFNTPKLVSRCRLLVEALDTADTLPGPFTVATCREVLRMLGIIESITPPPT